MAFEVNNIDFQTKKVVGTSEFAASGLISFPQDKPLKKVLNVFAYVSSISGEAIDTDYNFQGKVNLGILYLTEENKPEKLLSEIQFQHSVKAFAEDEYAEVKVVECHLEESEATYAKVSVLMFAEVVGKVTSSLAVLSGEEDNYVTDKFETKYTSYVAGSKTNFELSGTAEIDKSATVLYANTTILQKNVTVGVDQVTISGEAKTKLGYMTEDGLFEETKIIEFSREFAATGANPESLANVVVYVDDTAFTFETEEKTKVNYVASVQAQISVYASKTGSTIRDVFSTNREIEVTYGCTNYSNFAENNCFNQTITANAEIESEGEVLLTSATAKIAKFELINKKINAEGVIFATAIYKNQEELCSLPVSVPFVIEKSVEIQGYVNLNNIQVETVGVSNKNGQVQLTFDLTVNYNFETEQYVEYVESIKDVGEAQDNTSAITIYVTKPNDTLFSVARALRVLPEQIVSQNEVVDGKFAAGQRIFVYSPLDAEF